MMRKDEGTVKAVMIRLEEQLRSGWESGQQIIVPSPDGGLQGHALPLDPTAWTPEVLKHGSKAPFAILMFGAWTGNPAYRGRMHLDPSRRSVAYVILLNRDAAVGNIVSALSYQLDDTIKPGKKGHVFDIRISHHDQLPQHPAIDALLMAWRKS